MNNTAAAADLGDTGTGSRKEIECYFLKFCHFTKKEEVFF